MDYTECQLHLDTIGISGTIAFSYQLVVVLLFFRTLTFLFADIAVTLPYDLGVSTGRGRLYIDLPKTLCEHFHCQEFARDSRWECVLPKEVLAFADEYMATEMKLSFRSPNKH